MERPRKGPLFRKEMDPGSTKLKGSIWSYWHARCQVDAETLGGVCWELVGRWGPMLWDAVMSNDTQRDLIE